MAKKKGKKKDKDDLSLEDLGIKKTESETLPQADSSEIIPEKTKSTSKKTTKAKKSTSTKKSKKNSSKNFFTKRIEKDIMKKFSSIIAPLVLILLITVITSGTKVNAELQTEYKEQFRLEQASTRFYVTNLTVGETWSVNCTAVYEGIFYMFLFNVRPNQTILDNDRNLIQDRVDEALIYNITPSEIPSPTIEDANVSTVSINYQISGVSLAYENPENKSLFYLEIVCMENGPDTFLLVSNVAIEAYFIPFIPGFPIAVIIPIVGVSVLGLIKKYRKRMVK